MCIGTEVWKRRNRWSGRVNPFPLRMHLVNECLCQGTGPGNAGGTGLVEGTVAFVKCVMDTEDDSQNARSLDCIKMEACSEVDWLNR